MNFPKKKVAIAIIGSGAIAEEGYLPAAAMASNVVVSHLVDVDVERAESVAARFRIPNFVDNYREIYGKVDAVVVATPPNSHAKISIDCMNNGLHVLCEKPLASSVEQAKDMLEACKRTGTHLGVGMVRRLAWSARILKKLIGSDMLGKIQQFDIEEGWEFNWPLRTGHLFQNKNARGVIEDTGPHLFDLLFWILGAKDAKVTRCEDDNRGGIEANALIELEVEGPSQRSTGRIELSFTRRLRNTMKFFGERGCLEAETVGANEVFFYPAGQDKEPLMLRQKNPIPKKKNQEFVLQLSNFADSIINGSKKYIPASEAVATLSLVEKCYLSRTPMVQPWEKKHLENFFGEKI
jgi:predicted dehydrogenase